MRKIAIIAGEASGDLIGAKLMDSLSLNLEFESAGIGGAAMIARGFQSTHNINDLSIIGFLEVLPRIPNILRIVREIVSFLQTYQPDILITIDSPGFNFRVVERLRALKVPFSILHYVSPTVWAYSPERVLKVTKLYDHLITILPFEKQYFSNLPVDYVGHPVTEDILPSTPRSTLKSKYGYQKNEKLVAITPGSRVSEVVSHLPTVLSAVHQLISQQSIRFALLTLPHLYERCLDSVRQFSLEKHIKVTADATEKRELMYCSDAALIKSGTVAIECASMRVPMVLFYRTSFLSYMIIKSKIKIKHISILNIMAKQMIVPELVQRDFSAAAICSELTKILQQGGGSRQVAALAPYLEQLKNPNNVKPSQAAAAVIMQYLNK